MATAKKKGRQARTKLPAMTADEAQEFEKFSVVNATILTAAAALKGCECMPYEDWFTLRRWNAQGMAVRKGEHGTKLTVMVAKAEDDGKGGEEMKARPMSATVFCRCQVQKAPWLDSDRSRSATAGASKEVPHVVAQ